MATADDKVRMNISSTLAALWLNVYLGVRTPFSLRNDDISAVTVNEVMLLHWRCAWQVIISSIFFTQLHSEMF